MLFEPIAIVGRGCVLPGALTPEALWEAVAAGRSLIGAVPEGRWGIRHARVMGTPEQSQDRTWSDQGGYVRGFERVFSAEGLAMDPTGLDPLVLWLLHAGREALKGVQPRSGAERSGLVIGNLSFPSKAMAQFAERTWLGDARADQLGLPAQDARARFMSGLPAHLVARGLGFEGPAFALDAACASSLYAIKFACDRLQDRSVDLMLAGAVNGADDLFIHVGFCALKAMSPTGRSRPFHADADGLVPAEGAALVALKRLRDAEQHGDRILGVIRGVGLSNDGRGRGLLVPSREGQVRAMRRAWSQAQLDPRQVGLIECHATGTRVGDRTEIESMSEVFAGTPGVPIGSLKSNLGHLITTAGAGGLLKVLGAMEAGVMPPTLHVDQPIDGLAQTPLRLLAQAERWPTDRPRRAAVSAFGFGGNNAHLIVEAPGLDPMGAAPAPPRPRPEVAIVAIGAHVGPRQTVAEVAAALQAAPDASPTAADTIALPMKGMRFPPRDLEQALPQQLMIQAVAQEAVAGLELPRETTGVLIGMGADPEVARYGARWRLAEWADAMGLPADELDAARDGVIPTLSAAGVIGTMPNIPANRLNSHFDLGGPSQVICAEELSGVRALQVATRALQVGEMDAAIVGAVDLSVDPVHMRALRGVQPGVTPGDGAVALVLKRRADAERLGEPVLAVIAEPDGAAPVALSRAVEARFGRPHAAFGLLEVAAGVLSLVEGRLPGGAPLPGERLALSVGALAGQTARVGLARVPGARLRPAPPLDGPTLTFLAHLPPVTLPEFRATTSTKGHAMSQQDESRFTPPLQPTGPQVMAAPPSLEAVLGATDEAPSPTPIAAPASAPVRSAQVAPAPPRESAPPMARRPHHAPVAAPPAVGMSPFHARLVEQQAHTGAVHRAFLEQMAQGHEAFMGLRQRSQAALLQAAQGRVQPRPTSAPQPAVAPPRPTMQARGPVQRPTAPVSPPRAEAPAPRQAPAPVAKPAAAPQPQAVTTPKPVAAPKPVAKPVVKPAQPAAAPVEAKEGPRRPVGALPGPKLDREGLKVHASGRISEIYGPVFAPQDGYEVQVRMPEPPLLLADRLMGIDATPGSMGKGTLWTETDVSDDAWYLHEGRMPAGIMIESGQADLMLISYLGIDLLVKGERAYRLLGCELTWHGELPKVGDTLEYDIHVDGHARQGDVRLFFFHYDCCVDGAPRLTVRNGQAGFFTREELDDSMGVLWEAETAERCPEPRLDPPRVTCERTRFDRASLEAFAQGRPWECFGPGFEVSQVHTRTPRISGGRMLFLDEVTHLEQGAGGGPWGRGYLRAVDPIAPDDWFFEGHFKNDPCMPGTLMFEGCLQAMAFYMTSLGVTLDKDGWRFEPVPDETYSLRCRGQVLPTSRELIYEVFVEEMIDGDVPTLYADLLCTVDGLKAFHCRRMGLRLVPDWPLGDRRRRLPLPTAEEEAGRVAEVDGFRFGYDALLACAWGKPSEAFGPMYARFDGPTTVPRLPGPPYHFMSRITRVEGPIGGFEAGAEVEVEYDIPPDAWYFEDNASATMPFCVLLEAALQPCGWLASYVGSALRPKGEVFFRNLDGTGTLLAELPPNAGTLRTAVKLTRVASSGGMIIESFEVECFLDDVRVYEMDTVFGFFPGSALDAQRGLPVSPEDQEAFDGPCERPVIDLSQGEAAPFFSAPLGQARMPEPGLLMLDRVTGAWPEGGAHGLGRYRGEKDVSPSEWFFRAHFYQDPVQPGSLGIEALIQLLQVAMLDKGLAEGIEEPRFEPLALEKALTWKYRGQVRTHNQLITSVLDVTEIGHDEAGPWMTARASLWVDGMRIYEANQLGMRIVSGAKTAPSAIEHLSLAAEPWLGDHRPTWTAPALPMMSMVERIAAAAIREDGVVTGLEQVRVARWLPIDEEGVRLRAKRVLSEGGDRVEVTLLDDDGVVATGVVRLAREYTSGKAPWGALADAAVEPDPYEAGVLFHGPALQALTALRMGATGSSASLDAAPGVVPVGVLNQRLLDAATHAIPHDRLSRWCPELGDDMVGYPAWIPSMTVHGVTPTSGEVRCEVRFDGFAGSKRFPRFKIQMIHREQVWCELTLVEALFPKGPLGRVEPLERRAFLRDGAYVPGVGLSESDGAETRLSVQAIAESDWLPGTVAGIYGVDDPVEVARRDHLASRLGVHPRVAEEAAPLTELPLEVERGEDAAKHAVVTVRAAGPERLELAEVEAFWDGWFDRGRWPVEDLFYGLIERFVRRVVTPSPEALKAVEGRSCLFLANHQVGVESLVFSILASGLLKVPTVTLAKAEHRDTWLGRLIAHSFTWPDVADPQVITFFDRADKSSLQGIIGELAAGMAAGGRSVMVHVEGTRSLSCREPVQKMSGAFIDMALKVGAPVVPVRFVGGLPTEPLSERIEFPVGHGRQDIWLGRPLLPEELAPMTYGDRKARVIDAINALGVAAADEAPNAPDPAFSAEVSRLTEALGVSPEHAALRRVLAEMDEQGRLRCPEVTRALLDATVSIDGLPGGAQAWIAEVRRWLGAAS